MKLIVCGHARHGKDQFCEYLGLEYTSSSMVALEKVIWPIFSEAYANKQACFEDRVNHRPKWHQLITEYNTPDLTRLARDIFTENMVYCGIRNREEFYAAKEEGLFDLSIWVDASGRKPPESEASCKMLPSDCDIVVTNDGSLEELRNKAEALKKALGFELVIIGGPGTLDDALGSEGGTGVVFPRSGRPYFVPSESELITGSRNLSISVKWKEVDEVPVKDLVVEWADEVFPNRTITNAITKMVLEEIPEYLMAQDDPMELADLGILLYDIAHLAGVDLEAAIRQKMVINKRRSWQIDDKTGLMNHIGGIDVS